MHRAVFKAGTPNYEYNRGGVYAHFNARGELVTNDAKVVEALSKAAPFITRVDEKPAPKPKPKPRAKKPQAKSQD